MENDERKIIDDIFKKKYSDPSSEDGYGLTATVFIDKNIATKVYSKAIPKSEVYKEAYMLAYLEDIGIDTSKAIDVNYEDGFWVLRMTTVYGSSMLNIIFGKLFSGDFDGAIKATEKMAEIQVKINKTSGIALPTYKNYATNVISENPALTDKCKEKLIALLKELPDGTNVCHGDIHPNNILCDDDGNWTVIDWPEMTSGDPCADASRTYVNMCRFADCSGFIKYMPNSSANLSNITDKFVEDLKQIDLMAVYLNKYCELMNIDAEDVKKWIPVQAGMLYGYKQEDLCNYLEQYLPK